MKARSIVDLFGNERPATEATQGVSLSLFDAAAERLAIASGRPVSQEHAEVMGAPSDVSFERRCRVRMSRDEACAQAEAANFGRCRRIVEPDLVFGYSPSIVSAGAVRYGPLDRRGRAWHIAGEFADLPKTRVRVSDEQRAKMKLLHYMQRGLIGGNADIVAQAMGEETGRDWTTDELLDDLRKPLVSPVDLLKGTGAPKACGHCGATLPPSRRRIGDLLGTDAQYCEGGKCAKAAQNRRAYVRRKLARMRSEGACVTN